jgi:hypothetical protein
VTLFVHSRFFALRECTTRAILLLPDAGFGGHFSFRKRKSNLSSMNDSIMVRTYALKQNEEHPTTLELFSTSSNTCLVVSCNDQHNKSAMTTSSLHNREAITNVKRSIERADAERMPKRPNVSEVVKGR